MRCDSPSVSVFMRIGYLLDSSDPKMLWSDVTMEVGRT